MTRPLIGIDDEVREMTDEEYAQYEKDISNYASLDVPSGE
jgi:hypothetical protein